MIPLLGVTWLFGLLSPVHKTFVHIFTILNWFPDFLSTLQAKHSDQRAFQKKDEHRFSIFYKEQLHKEELTGQSK
ncbi:unnamed protein product [Pocillopora meandrina]|uniref:Uncharacterized protein n=1 Tax=Pocillopora meandrina TaxID=46732 RepID=A0AAU9Y3L9_9CNID|nr:unnamed protein product [Pocillopora meandrina]